MIATNNQQAAIKKIFPELDLTEEKGSPTSQETHLINSNIQNLNAAPQQLLTQQVMVHHTNAGLNPLVDNCSYLLSVLAKLKQIPVYYSFSKLQTDLTQEIKQFQETIEMKGYNSEYSLVCRYVLCAVFDDIILNTTWGTQGGWRNFALLPILNQEPVDNKFFAILERILKEPALYIDLMELIYICLSMGYKGEYRLTEHSQYQLEQIINNLYHHIRAYRGHSNKPLSARPFKMQTHSPFKPNNPSLLFVFFVTTCIVMTIFISLGYVMDVISNEAYDPLTQVENTISKQ